MDVLGAAVVAFVGSALRVGVGSGAGVVATTGLDASLGDASVGAQDITIAAIAAAAIQWRATENPRTGSA